MQNTKHDGDNVPIIFMIRCIMQANRQQKLEIENYAFSEITRTSQGVYNGIDRFHSKSAHILSHTVALIILNENVPILVKHLMTLWTKKYGIRCV